jgi:hypothetical protein
MERYKNFSGKSGVRAYQIREHSIVIEFEGNGKYLYSYDRPGREHVEEMKKLAIEGLGLSTYISRNVKNKYLRKL